MIGLEAVVAGRKEERRRAVGAPRKISQNPSAEAVVAGKEEERRRAVGVPGKNPSKSQSPVPKRPWEAVVAGKKDARRRAVGVQERSAKTPSRQCRSTGDVAGAARDDVDGAADTDHVGRRGGSWAEREEGGLREAAGF